MSRAKTRYSLYYCNWLLKAGKSVRVHVSGAVGTNFVAAVLMMMI